MVRKAFYTDTGGRAVNEDSVRIRERGGALICVVADGLGGQGGGDAASGAAATLIADEWDGSVSPAALAGLFERAHRKIKSMQTPRLEMMSTAVALVLSPRQAAWAHAGDSRLYIFRNGQLVVQTRDHSASQIAVLLGQITPEEIRFHSDRATVLRALGQDGELKTELGSAQLDAGHYAFLLCTDGFWEYVLEREMAETLARSQSPDDWLADMRALLRTRVPADNDNNTAAAVWLDI